MKIKLKKFLCTMLTALICIGTFCTTASAAEKETVTVDSVDNVENVTTRSVTVLSEGGVLSNDTKLFTFTVPSSTTYTFTMSVGTISGNDGIWTILQKAGKSATIDKNISGSYQKRYTLTSGTWYLRLTTSGTCSYSVSIHETF